MIRYEIEGGNLPVVICYPEEGQTLCSESGAMSWMSPNMHMETNSGGGFKKAMGVSVSYSYYRSGKGLFHRFIGG